MTEEQTEDKNEEELSKTNPLFTEAFDAIFNVVRALSFREPPRLQELQRFAKLLAVEAVTIARWVGQLQADNELDEDNPQGGTKWTPIS